MSRVGEQWTSRAVDAVLSGVEPGAGWRGGGVHAQCFVERSRGGVDNAHPALCVAYTRTRLYVLYVGRFRRQTGGSRRYLSHAALRWQMETPRENTPTNPRRRCRCRGRFRDVFLFCFDFRVVLSVPLSPPLLSLFLFSLSRSLSSSRSIFCFRSRSPSA